VKRFTPEEQYKFNIRKQRKALEEFAEHEVEFAGDLIEWYGLRGEDMPADEYRACAFFINKEFSHRPGSLTLLYGVYLRCLGGLPAPARETAFSILAFRFRLYARTLQIGGYDGPKDW
jgi:hypothetical protein